MNWTTALWRGLLIGLYFVIFTVWLPDTVLSLGFIADSSRAVRDATVLVIWAGALGAGLYLLRRVQSQGLI